MGYKPHNNKINVINDSYGGVYVFKGNHVDLKKSTLLMPKPSNLEKELQENK